jgi:glycosyltransferase involved in cell wall biosynthesis
MDKVVILIPTRNRPQQLLRLLRSISVSKLKPVQVVIVSSGIDVSEVINRFRDSLQITYIHSAIKGQVAQKRLGVKVVRRDSDWCVFLDDDLVVEETTIGVALETASAYSKKDVIGIGLSLIPTSREFHFTPRWLRIARILKLSSELPGRVLESGHATSYLQSKNVIETQWLNGASIWRTGHIQQYGVGLPSTNYAACEDLIFSYPLSKIGTLIYVPNAKLAFQSEDFSKLDSIEAFKAASFWRFYFVSCHKELSMRWFLMSQIARTFFLIKKSEDKSVRVLGELMQLNLKLFTSCITGSPSQSLLNQLID